MKRFIAPIEQFHDNHNLLSVIIWVIGITIIIFSIAEITYFNFFQEKLDSDIVKIHAAFLIVLTIILVCIAWIQLGGINKTARADFLLRLDDRFGSDNIIKARVIIHELYRKTKPQCEHAKYACSSCKESHLHRIRKEIELIGKDEKLAEKFIYLRNFLDFMETVGYFSHKGHVSPKDVNDLMGGTVIYHYNVFKDWIDYRKERDADPYAYCEFKWLHDEIKRLDNRKLNPHIS